jgi:CRP-like cAMP-binding protein
MKQTMASKQIFLDKFKRQFFKHINVDEKDFSSLSNLFNEKKYPRKTYLLRAGDKWGKIYYIHQGLIRLYYTDTEGREFNKAFFWEQHCIWPVAPRDRHEDSLFSIDALEDVTVRECSFQLLYEWLKNRGCWEKFALPFAETLVEQKFLREHDFLLHSATERFKKFSKKYPNIILRLPDYHLASYLGITNVSLSRIKSSINVNK